jgi:GTP-binding protein HflX
LLTAVLQPRFDKRDKPSLRTVEADFAEAQSLIKAIDLENGYATLIPVRDLNPATFFGKGSVERVGEEMREAGIKLAFVNADLTPTQQRNLERTWKLKVIDRQGLILEIFSTRARTREGKLQVELAYLVYQRSLLVKAWTHLERQRGGLGKTGGPGEMQKELHRRVYDEKIKTIKRDLEHIVQNRAVQRAARERVPFPVVALVGYTNAGKSTLFNTLTNEKLLAKDLLFATLDTTLRAVKLPSGRTVILSDTVGFISQLPTGLIAAFRATLEETIHADIILHVRDIASNSSEAEAQDVKETLKHLELDPQTPIWEVWNKIDLLPEAEQDALTQSASLADPPSVAVSAITGRGLDKLLSNLDNALSAQDVTRNIILDASEGEALAWLYRHTTILDRQDDEARIDLQIRASLAKMGQFNSLFHKENAGT